MIKSDFDAKLHSEISDQHFTTEVLDNGVVLETSYIRGKVSTRKYNNPDGSYEVYSAQGYKTIEQTADGVYRIFMYQSDKIDKEIYSDGTIIRYYENQNISSIEKPEGVCTIFYDNKNIFQIKKDDYEISLFKDGRTQYEFKDEILTVNPEYFSYYRIGIKDKTIDTHWNENIRLNPEKKTVLCLGGDQTKDSREANGNINVFTSILGLSARQLDDMQLCSCYRPSIYANGLYSLIKKAKNTNLHIEADYEREILSKFIPFIAQTKDGKFERYSSKKLNQNFSNLLILTHCYGANDLPMISKSFTKMMQKVGYSQQEISNALKQIICITNNSQREFNDKTGFTTFHRYSVTDGQFEPEYDNKYSADYPVFLAQHNKYNQKKGKESAFVRVNDNEVLMVFDRVLKGSGEHNQAFWTTKEENLTLVGKKQALLMENIGKYWSLHTGEIPNALSLLEMCSKDTNVKDYVTKAIQKGKVLYAEHKSPLSNHHILKKQWNEFNNKDIEPQKIGIFKILSEKNGR